MQKITFGTDVIFPVITDSFRGMSLAEGLFRGSDILDFPSNIRIRAPWTGLEFGKPVQLFSATTFKGLHPSEIKERKIVSNVDIGQVLVELVDSTKILMRPKYVLSFQDSDPGDFTPHIKILRGTLFLEYHASYWQDIWGEEPEVDTSEGVGDIYGHVVLGFPVKGFLDELGGTICLENLGGKTRPSVTEFIDIGLFRKREMPDGSLSEPSLKEGEFVSVKKYFEGAKIIAYRPSLTQEGYIE